MKTEWVVVGDEVSALFAESEDKAREIMARDGITGTLMPRSEYDDSTDRMRGEKLERLYSKIQGLSVLELIKPEALTAKGLKAQKVIGRIRTLQSASAAEVEVFNPDES